MSTIQQNTFGDQIEGVIKKALQSEVEREFDALKKNLVEDLERRKNEICAGIMIGLMKTVEFEVARDRVTIVIKEIKP